MPSDIVKLAGGAASVARASENTAFAVGADAVFKWYGNGIPDQHWPLLIELTALSAQEIYEANQRLRKSKCKRSRSKTCQAVA